MHSSLYHSNQVYSGASSEACNPFVQVLIRIGFVAFTEKNVKYLCNRERERDTKVASSLKRYSTADLKSYIE